MTINNKDIVLTDPCYVIPDIRRDDWDLCGYGEHMERLNISPFWIKRTGVGDGTWNVDGGLTGDGKKVLGSISSDSGQIGCFDLKEVLAYNPDFLDNYADGLAAVIRGFTGEIEATHVNGTFGRRCLVITIKGDSTDCGHIDGCTNLGDLEDGVGWIIG